MSDHVIHIFLYSVNLIFIVTHLYGWLLKWFYRPLAYHDNFHELFPAQRAVGVLYLMQLMEVPYLLHVGERDALLYVNSFAMLFYSLQMLVMCKGYFFPAERLQRRHQLMFLPGVVIVVPLLLQVLGVVVLPPWYRTWTFVAVPTVFAFYFAMSVRMALRIGQVVNRVNEASFADEADFPVRFAQLIQWVPTLVCMIVAINFAADDAMFKAARDVLFTLVSIWFCIITLNPWRKVFSRGEQAIIDRLEALDEEQATGQSAFRLTDERFAELQQGLHGLLVDEHIFTEPHLAIDTLLQRLGTNANYFAELIRRSGYHSFYDMINHYRVEHAIALIGRGSGERLADVAASCGFSSLSSMSKAFKQQGKSKPSDYRSKD